MYRLAPWVEATEHGGKKGIYKGSGMTTNGGDMIQAIRHLTTYKPDVLHIERNLQYLPVAPNILRQY